MCQEKEDEHGEQNKGRSGHQMVPGGSADRSLKGLQALQGTISGTPWHHLMAASTLVLLPVLVLFFLTQRTFIRGIATTGLK